MSGILLPSDGSGTTVKNQVERGGRWHHAATRFVTLNQLNVCPKTIFNLCMKFKKIPKIFLQEYAFF
jgi:hypothetical protein